MTGQVPFETCQRGGMAKINKNPLPIIQLQIIYDTPFPPPLSSTSFSYSDGLSKSYMASFSITSFQNSLLTVLRDLLIKISFKFKKNQFGGIMSLNVMDEAVLRSPEGVSAGGPPAARSSCPPGPRSGRSYIT